MNTGRKSGGAYTPNMRMPGAGNRRSNRALPGLLLSLLLPPAGLMFLWRKGVFRVRGRVFLSALATIEMAVIIVLFMPKAELYSLTPTPVTPSAVTAAPDDEVLTALSNIDQLLYQQQLEEVISSGGSEEDLMSTEEQDALKEAEREAIMNTTVYSVYSGAVYYHSGPVCGTQSNRRSLTVAEAMSEALAACPNCDAPYYTG